MTMTEGMTSLNEKWQKSLGDLRAYIEANPSIVFKHDTVIIPGELKPKFYLCFDKVRMDVAQMELSKFFYRSETLRANYLAIEKTMCKAPAELVLPQGQQVNQIKKFLYSPLARLRNKLRLDEFKFERISLEDDLRQFLFDPVQASMRILFEPLFDLLQGKTTDDAFKDTIKEKLPLIYHQLYHSIYEKWIILNLLKALDVKAAYATSNPIIAPRDLLKFDRTNTKIIADPPIIRMTNVMNMKFGRNIHELCTTNTIVKLAKTKKYLGIKSGFERWIALVKDFNEKRPSLPLKTVSLGHKNTPLLIYIGDNPNKVSLVADKNTFWRPDLVIQCEENADFKINDGVEKTKLLHNSFKPIKGTFVVQGPFANADEIYEQRSNISVLNVGFDPTRLEPIIDCLLK